MPVSDEPVRAPGNRRGLVATAVVFGVAALWFGSGLAAGPDRQTQALPTPAPTPTAVSDEPAFVVRTPVPTPTPTPTPLRAPQISRQDREASVAWAVLGLAGDDVRVAYESTSGMTVLVAEEEDVGLVVQRVALFDEPVQLSRQARSFGFGAADLGALTRQETGAVVATTTDPTRLVGVSPNDAVLTTASATEPGTIVASVPEGAVAVALDGWGIAFDDDQRTTIIGLEGATDVAGLVLDAIDNSLLVSPCAGCAHLIAGREGTATEVLAPDGWVLPDARYQLSPSLKHIVRILPDGSASMLEISTGTTFWVADKGLGVGAWDPAGRFLAWLDTTDRQPALKLMLVDPNNWITVALEDIAAPPPRGHDAEILVLGRGR